MKHLMILLIGLIAAGCASQPVELPDWDLAARDVEVEASDPIELPDLCAIPWQPEDVECWKALDLYDIAAAENYNIAKLNASASRNGDQAYDQLIEAAKIQQQLSQIRQDMLERERRSRELDKWYYRAIIVLVGLAGANL